MSSILIREATLPDAEDIARAHILAWQETYRGIAPQAFLDSLDINQRIESWKVRLDQANHNVFVAVLDGQICGFIGGGPVRQPVQDFDAELYAINLVDAAKRMGIGRRLDHHLAEILRSMGLTKVVVWVLAENPSRRFYERLGAQELAEQKTTNFGGADLLEVAYGWRDLQSL
jgi:ribosomal protein S18 acetylase RimI-like enzyme